MCHDNIHIHLRTHARAEAHTHFLTHTRSMKIGLNFSQLPNCNVNLMYLLFAPLTIFRHFFGVLLLWLD